MFHYIPHTRVIISIQNMLSNVLSGFFYCCKKSFAPQYQKLSFSISRSIRGCHIMSKTDRSESGQDLRKVCIPNKDMIRNTKTYSLPPESVKISLDVDMKISWGGLSTQISTFCLPVVCWYMTCLGNSGDVLLMKSTFVASNSIWRELDLRNINQQEQIRQYGTNTNDLKKL